MTFPTLIVECAFSAGASTSLFLHLDDSARGKLGTGTLAGSDVWTDITSYVTSVSTRRGANRITSPVLRYEAGTCTIVLDNSDRRFDPTNLDGPYVVAGLTQVTPMRAVRIRATHNGTTYDIFRGFTDEWLISYDGPNYSTVTLTATDATKVLRTYDRAAVSAVGAGEDSGARVERILDSVSWPATDRVIATGDTTLQSTTLAGDAWSELSLVQDTEIGELYIDAAGRVYFRNRLAILEDTRSNTSQATFGDEPGELRYESLTVNYDDTDLINLARIARAGGAAQTATDSESVTLYLTHVHERSDLLMQSDGIAADYAGFLVQQTAEPELRFASMTINPRRNDSSEEDALFTQVLARQFGDRVTAIRRPPGGGDPIQRDVFIRGVAHEIAPKHWRTTFALQSATRFEFLLLGSADLGTLGDNALAY